jgi:hypothetical protein
MDEVLKILLSLGQQIDRLLSVSVNTKDLTKLLFDLPAKRKRFELFKFYSQVGIEDRINGIILLNKRLV